MSPVASSGCLLSREDGLFPCTNNDDDDDDDDAGGPRSGDL